MPASFLLSLEKPNWKAQAISCPDQSKSGAKPVVITEKCHVFDRLIAAGT